MPASSDRQRDRRDYTRVYFTALIVGFALVIQLVFTTYNFRIVQDVSQQAKAIAEHNRTVALQQCLKERETLTQSASQWQARASTGTSLASAFRTRGWLDVALLEQTRAKEAADAATAYSRSAASLVCTEVEK